MKVYLYFSVIWCLIFISGGCSRQQFKYFPPQFKDTMDIKGQILNDSFILGNGFNIEYYKDYLIVDARGGEGEELVHLFRISDGSHLKSILVRGRGPGEALTVGNMNVDHTTGEVLSYDLMLKKLFHFNIDTVLQYEDYQKHIVSEAYPVYMYDVYPAKNGYVTYGGYRLKTGESPRFSIVRDDSVVYRYFNYPEIAVLPKPTDISITYGYLEHLSMSPDKTKLVCLSGFGAILEIFDVYDHEIKLDIIKGFYKHEFQIDKYLQPLPVENKTIVGCIDIYTSDSFIYSIFLSHPDFKKLKDIAVFDWKGDCIRLYHVDYDLVRICVDEEKNIMYAIAKNQEHETVLIKFDLN